MPHQNAEHKTKQHDGHRCDLKSRRNRDHVQKNNGHKKRNWQRDCRGKQAEKNCRHPITDAGAVRAVNFHAGRFSNWRAIRIFIADPAHTFAPTAKEKKLGTITDGQSPSFSLDDFSTLETYSTSSIPRVSGSITLVFRSMASTVVRCSVPSRLDAITGKTWRRSGRSILTANEPSGST